MISSISSLPLEEMLLRPLLLSPGAGRSGHNTAWAEHRTAALEMKKLKCAWMPTPAKLLPSFGPEK